MGGYVDASGTPGNGLTSELQFVDTSVGKLVQELRLQGVYDSTAIIISAKHGQSPIDRSLRRAIPDTYATVLANDGYAFDVADDAALVWLDPNVRTPALYQQALADLRANQSALGISQVLAREDLAKVVRDPFKDSRTPDFFVVVDHGVIYTTGSKLAEHGGVADDDRHVALLVSAAALSGQTVERTVFTTQIAPTILRAFQIPPDTLLGVREEGTEVLPGLARGSE